MISEVDIRDWEFKIKDAKDATDELDDYSRMAVGVNPIGPRTVLEKFIKDVEKLISQNKKQVPALFQEKKQ